MRRLPLASVLFAVLALSGCHREVRPSTPPQPTLSQVADELFTAIEGEGALTSVLVLDAQTGEPLYARREHLRSLPASTMKVVSTASVLAALGPEFRFRTKVLLEGTRQGELFTGDLVVEASGDPTLGSWRFPETTLTCDQIAEAMTGRGIRKWRGALQVRGPDTGLDGPLGPGWAWDDVAYSMSAAPMPFVFRENVVDFSMLRAEGAPCSAQPAIQLTPRFAPFSAVVQIDTKGSRSGFACLREHNPSRTRCVWRSTGGSCPRAMSTRLAIDDPQALFAACVEDALTRRGITRIPAPPAPRDAAPPPVNEPLIELVSPQLGEIVKVTNKESHNLYAERLALRFARERTGSEDYAALRKAMAAELTRRGISPRDLRPIDGSGLSRYNLATARGLAQLLYTSLKEPYGEAFVESLPIAGVDGTLGSQPLSAEALARLRAKTGTLSSQKAYVGVAERPHDAEHPRVVFALMLGNMDEQPAVSAGGAFQRFAEALIHLPLR
ncbi:D-alanyl-D-alanine carboxypeptidase/D-alanyl-D-alanine endopeptidase [Hyalangium rubrum]|uniref:D-alanyl-D-alanine carboxypeptidase/D-alanyl-D-alanine-endopeptidase n=1 Tax=Hyalangium rubrum TaxID=3103134 RepID=A0ABU5HFJ0_9BACT|nr:D-alanyl-D-alanine carboxypeptidase/D-alanyl-D-alanine-endopeptidase [Hyalangium sp. s54d21]MDY7230830.1 D-alanyl-D-alanine carboxypeptidase/D-alanyl-D-alanine-endopeptidase [Hyalangium sp. s54d21]